MVSMNDRVLKIMENTNVMSIKDKEKYTKLILYKKVDLKKFPNVREVEFKFDPTLKHGIDFSNLEKYELDNKDNSEHTIQFQILILNV